MTKHHAGAGVMLAAKSPLDASRADGQGAAFAAAASQCADFIGLLGNARLIVMMLDPQGAITFANEQCRRASGRTQAELAGRTFIEMMVEDGERRRVNDRLSQLLSGTQAHFNHESVLACAGGESLTIDWHHTHLKGREAADAVLCIGVDVTARRKAEKNLAWLADHDPLTKIYNRRRFEADLDKMLRRAERYGHGGALLYFDIDDFKLINDAGAHKGGGEPLSLIGGRLAHFGPAPDS